MSPRFEIAMRGCNRAQVDAFLDDVDLALASGDAAMRRCGDAAMRASVCQLLRSAFFGRQMRGYAPAEVDQAIEQLRREFC
jgi:DivIVA domain-containing protein